MSGSRVDVVQERDHLHTQRAPHSSRRHSDILEQVLENDICTECNELLFDYMYLGWTEASDDDKYWRTYMEMTCSSAPNDDGDEVMVAQIVIMPPRD